MEEEQLQQFKLYFSRKSFEYKYDISPTGDKYRKYGQDKHVRVYEVQNKKSNQIFIAKEYKISQQDFIENIWEELNTIIRTRNQQHPNIIKYHDAFLYQDDDHDIEIQYFKQTLLIVMEKGDYDLEQFSTNQEQKTKKKYKKIVPDQQKYQQQVYDYLKQTLNGLQYLKQNHIYHRDIKPQNLVVINGQLKIIDFDVVKMSFNQNTQTVKCNPGTAEYIDPNIIDEKAEIDEENEIYRYNVEKADIFSTGMSFLQIALKWSQKDLQKKLRHKIDYFYSENKNVIEFKQELQQYTQNIEHNHLKNLIENMVVLDVKERWDLQKCINENRTIQKTQQKQLIKSINNQNVFDHCQMEQKKCNIIDEFKQFKNIIIQIFKYPEFNNSIQLYINDNPQIYVFEEHQILQQVEQQVPKNQSQQIENSIQNDFKKSIENQQINLLEIIINYYLIQINEDRIIADLFQELKQQCQTLHTLKLYIFGQLNQSMYTFLRNLKCLQNFILILEINQYNDNINLGQSYYHYQNQFKLDELIYYIPKNVQNLYIHICFQELRDREQLQCIDYFKQKFLEKLPDLKQIHIKLYNNQLIKEEQTCQIF